MRKLNSAVARHCIKLCESVKYIKMIFFFIKIAIYFLIVKILGELEVDTWICDT